MHIVAVLVAACVLPLVGAISLDTNNVTSIKNAAALIADGLLDYYEGTTYGGTVGMFTSPYYWWEAGGAWGSLIDYTYYMENDTYVDLIKTALTYQVGDDYNYIPLNQSTTEGNDDQAFWGIAVMAAAEKNFSNPDDPELAWLALAQAVFNTMSARWDYDDCAGGLRWQIFQWNSGYDYKNSVLNGALFHLAARLARYTSNDSYVEWAERVFDWMYGVGLLTEGDWWFIYDGVNIDDNCSDITKLQWTYNQGLMLAGCAYMYNYTLEEKWLNRTTSILHAAQVFFYEKSADAVIMYEAACQLPTSDAFSCNTDQRSFKAYFSRFLGLTSVLVPQTYDTIRAYIQDSANAAAWSACTGGSDGHTCGLSWTNSTWDGVYGLGEQMCALEVIQNLRVADLPGPLTADTGGTSIGNPAAGYSQTETAASPLDLSAKDTAGASIITAVVGVAIIGTAVWLVI
ncbi:defective cell wall [Metschnikowia bicuspidata var. bicuspidata NRRL YB-4993]|uniref:Mannan endo-1,6-alpha-mannosidase n=1 Tax=Metschnikowia bicuspidata var. bicuspidata NRRL YB-4993 TaxID=869754 RepID=A0A1A0H9I7_9ASCO|nr:defective cell wall [Metschnikowia bicuspidata var. bicuspidata NRRL YB-4993]OBA20789.1 defective cell wall [Metschnikowia bicuspidata var. bicuspidata NRRL YB-4993]